MRTYVCPIVGDGSSDEPFRAKVLDLGATYSSAAIGAQLSGATRGHPSFSWTIVYCDADDWSRIDGDSECVEVIETSNLNDFDLQPSQSKRDAAADAANDDEVRNANSFRGLVAHLLHRQYPGADADRFIEGAAGHRRIAGGAHGSGFIVDHFTDTDSTTLQSHTPDTGGSWEALGFDVDFNSSSDDAAINSNALISTTDSESRVYRNATTPGSAEYTVSAVWLTGGSGDADDRPGLCGRMSAAGTALADVDLYVFHPIHGNFAGGTRLSRLVSGSNTTLASGNPSTANNTTYNISLSITDSLKEATIDGLLTLDSTDNTITQVGRAGVSAQANNTGSLDDFLAAEGPAIEITSVTPSTFADGDTGVTIAGSGYEAAQGTGKVELGDSSDYATATLVEQTVTSWADTSIDFTVVQGALSAGTVYVFVTNDTGDTTNGFEATLTEVLGIARLPNINNVPNMPSIG